MSRCAILRLMDIDDQRTVIRGLIRAMMERTGLDATGLARAAGIAPSTLTRFLNKPVKHLLTARTLAKLSEASGVPVPLVGPVTSSLQRELLNVFGAMSEEQRQMYVAMGRGVIRQEAPEDPPAAPIPSKERAPPTPPPPGKERPPPRNPTVGEPGETKREAGRPR